MTGPVLHLSLRALNALYGDIPERLAGDNGTRGRPLVTACRGEQDVEPLIIASKIHDFLATGKIDEVPTCPECCVLWDAAMERL